MHVNPWKEEALKIRMLKLGIKQEEIEQNFVLSSGHGGQNVNKTSTCVYLKHLPTGLEVKCSDSRSQHLNRFLALRRLADKIEERMRGRQSEIQQRIEKIRRQKRKRSKRAKEKMLRSKRLHSEKKSSRSSGFYSD
jgi:protein subunit release factor B